MANYTNLIALINQYITTNGQGDITGAVLNNVLLAMVNSLGNGYQFAGVALPNTNPGSPDQKVFYIAAQSGTYQYFNNTVVADGIYIFQYDTSWSVEKLNILSRFHTNEILQNVDIETAIKTGAAGLLTNGAVAIAVNQLLANLGKCIKALGANVTLIDSSGYTTVSGKFVNADGTISTNSAFSYRVIPVQTMNFYLFDGLFGANITIPFIVWFDANGQFLIADSRAGQTSQAIYLQNELLAVPEGAAYAYMNVQNQFASYSTFSHIIDPLIDVTKEVMRTRGVLPSCSLNDVKSNGFWILTDDQTYTNMPYTTSVGFLRVTIADNGQWGVQEFIGFSGPILIKRRFSIANNTFESWQVIGSNTYNVSNTFNEYTQTVNLSASPSIRTDTNNYLASTNDTTDRTSAILAMLQATGICHLGPGIFYIDSLIMPDDSKIIGCGGSTKVYLATGSNKFAIKMGKRCTVSNFHLFGGSTITVNSTVGNRHGILWQGNYTQSEVSANQPQFGFIDNMLISSFAGGGITCYDTGYGTFNHLSVTNVNIDNCDAGINISYFSEYHKFTNVRCYSCYYGCINNGGNNIFVNCDFSTSVGIGFLMDNANGQSPNNSHGSCIGCVFNHTANNAGFGIKVLGCDNGFIFDGCQIFFSKIDVENSNGIVFSSCNFGYTNCDTTIVNGGVLLFSNNIYERKPTITITNNTNVHFTNNYSRYDNSIVVP